VLGIQINQGSSGTVVYSELKASLLSITQSQFVSEYAGVSEPNVNDGPVQVSPGSCVIGFGGPNNPVGTGLDAGPGLTVTPPGGSAFPVPQISTGLYKVTGTSLFPSGTYSLNNGGGGANVGPLSAGFTVPAFATWTNQSALANSAIARANGVTLTWSTGASAGAYIDIQGSSNIQGSNGGNVTFECAAPLAAGTFTVPSSALLALPSGGGGLSLNTYFFEPISVPGFNLAYIAGSNQTIVPVSWK
jgi:hypothetical protein